MAPKKPAAEPAERVYPHVEQFLESRSKDDVAQAFSATREALTGLPKPKAEQGKRALAAIDRTEALLGQLFDVKAELEANGKAKKPRR
jgi:hypothetical protein